MTAICLLKNILTLRLSKDENALKPFDLEVQPLEEYIDEIEKA